MKKLLLAAIIFGSSLLFAEAQYGGTLVFGRSGDSSTLDPSHATDGESFYGTTQVYDNLVQFKLGTTEIEPALAESWTVSEDGKEYIFKLRQGVYFEPTAFFKKKVEFTADDVVYSIKRQFDKKDPHHIGLFEYWSAMDMDNIVEDVIKVDKYTVKFRLKKSEAPFIANLAMDFASILCKEYADELLKKGKINDINRFPVGTGPFIFVKWAKDDKIFFEANKNYWNGKPYVDKLIFKVIPNSSVRAAELKTSQIHIMDFPNPEEVASLKKEKSIKLISQEGMNVGYLSMNMERKELKDVRVRKAINHAINKQAIVDAIYAGFGKVAKSPIPPTMWGYNSDIVDYEYDIEKAKKLLKEAGYEKGFEVTLFAMPVPRPYIPNGKKVAEAMQADLAKVNIKAKIVTYDWTTYLEKIKFGEHDLCLIGWTGDNGDPDNFLYVLLSKAATNKPAQNFSFWINDEFNDLIEKAKIISDVEERTKLYKKAQEIFIADVPWVTIANSLLVIPAKSNIEGFLIDPVGKRRFLRTWIKK